MELKKFQVLETESLKGTNLQQLQNFYQLSSISYVKKSGNLIDTENMIIINTQQEDDNKFIRQIQMDDTQLHIFQSANGIYWYKNLLNMPFQALNLTSSQILQDLYFEQGQNLIALYDSSCQCVQIYNIINNIKLISQIMFNTKFDLKIKLVDWNNYSFIYVSGTTLYLYDQNNNIKNEQIGLLDSNIMEYQYCFQQQIAVAMTQKQSLYIIKIQEKASSKVETNFQYVNQQIVLQLKFVLKCTENILIIYSPVIQIINLLTATYQEEFLKFNWQIGMYYSENIPIVNVKEKLIICVFDIYVNYFERNNLSIYLDYFDYRQNNTNTYYDLQNNVLIGVTGATKRINIINIPGEYSFFRYYTINSFLQGATYYYKDKTSVIIIDTTPVIYLCNYVTRNITTFNTIVKDTQGIQMDQNKNIIFLYSYQFISALKFPEIYLCKLADLGANSLNKYSFYCF
ncbi:hypothetical protein TTHERM_000295859 (macronuclear) [Tetrahymena thermophila SB210]|uniref:Uncharacterized protein n=1 Tax=Tetrahymena thermophila (strain SB210) TaxID=312017 RepID=W7X6U8_TETTS|nr:hypothetical protein TTHERM_000295859 [Tetrahymena thermophila SB210]EWS75100.1 hypothetical protein TTHERM_000295859 [Tetrahymena thermophila SB210]|eukprot:XP_012652338.1 hypothetical protein TTHERM_000295859 [Tetrahymena thermophila SB210]